MTLKEILEKCSMLEIHEERENSEEYVELIIRKTEIDRWIETLANTLGTPQKPAGAAPTEEDISVTKDYGGIAENQVLFRRKFEAVSVLAMFWPWGDDVYVTLKMVCLRN